MIDNKISAIIEYNLPEFVREDYPMYVAFVKAYFEFLEEEGNLLHYMERFKRNLDPDLADDDFLLRYQSEFANTFPLSNEISTNQLLKLMKEFYLSKGSEDSFRFIFTVLYNKSIDIIYPRDYMYTPSSGTYTSDIIVYISGENWFKLNYDVDYLTASIQGITSTATAIIDTITTSYYDGQLVLRLELSSSDGDFEVGEDVILAVEDVEVQETIFGAITSISIDDGGTNYEIDDELTITDSSTGRRAKAKISQLAKGKLDEVNIINPGSGYEVGDLVKAQSIIGSNGYGFRARVYEVDVGGEILSVRVEHGGYDYTKTTNAVISSTGGSGAILELNGDDIGKIQAIEVIDGGINYQTTGTISISINTVNGVGASLIPQLGPIFTEPKRYRGITSTPSGVSKTQDSFYYQQFSYVIASDISPSEWLGTVKRIGHPAGTQLFGMYRVYLYGELLVDKAPTTDNTYSINVNFLNDIDVGLVYASTRFIELERDNGETCVMGLTYADLDDMKFLDTFTWNVSEFQNLSLLDIYSDGCVDSTEKQESSVITIT